MQFISSENEISHNVRLGRTVETASSVSIVKQFALSNHSTDDVLVEALHVRFCRNAQELKYSAVGQGVEWRITIHVVSSVTAEY